MSYNDIYQKRLNRYGTDFKSRLQNERQKEFENYLTKSVYRIDFPFNGELEAGTFEKYKQDNTQTLSYLLTRVSTQIEPGTILQIPDINKESKPWMVYWLENLVASGYNRYIMLKMTHLLSWTDKDGQAQTTWAYLCGPATRRIADTIKSGTGAALYAENENKEMFIAPTNIHINKDDYLEIGEDDMKDAYVVVGYDRHSTTGVEYISIDPVSIRGDSSMPENTIGDQYWINGGNS